MRHFFYIQILDERSIEVIVFESSLYRTSDFWIQVYENIYFNWIVNIRVDLAHDISSIIPISSISRQGSQNIVS